MYNTPVQKNDKTRCLIVPSKKWKLVWDMYVVFLLLFISILVPYRLAFFPEDDFQMMMIYAVIDTCFFIDLIMTFFTTTVDPRTQMYITDRRIIAKNYLRFWFWIDMISILPFDAVSSSMDAGVLIRFAKIGKLYKLIRLSRLAKLFKLLKG